VGDGQGEQASKQAGKVPSVGGAGRRSEQLEERDDVDGAL